ncbi:MAG: flagellar hook-associated protein FlgK [Porcipelethomonas sp.]
MRPTFLGFEAAKTGVFTSQKALDIVGNNLSNINTEGYTRQRVDQVSVSVAGYPNRLKQNIVDLAGMGTNVNGVSQLRDERLDTAFREEYANTGYYDQQSSMLSDIESILAELDVGDDGNGYGLSFAIKEMFTALEDFSYNASSGADANVFANSVSNVTRTLNKLYTNLEKSAEQYKKDLSVSVDETNTILKDIADLNVTIRRSIVTNNYTEQYGPNELKDQRNLLIDKLSAYGKVKVEEQNDGTVTVELNGHKCVWDKEFDAINYQENNNGTVQLNWTSDGENAAKDVGIFRASTEIINGRGMGVISSTESTYNGFLFYEDKLDAFAQKLTYVLNNTFPDETDADGNVISYKKLVGETVETEDGFEVYPEVLTSAKNINITDALMNDSSYLINEDNCTDNTALLELINKLTKDEQTFSTSSDTFTGTFQEFVADYMGTLGSDNTYAEGRYEASMKMVSEIQDNRDSISGVSESEETVNMMTYNRSFQAAARMMTVMDELLDVIINRMAV